MSDLVSFGIGVITGATVTLLYGMVVVERNKKKARLAYTNLVAEIKKQQDTAVRLKALLAEITEVTRIQLELAAKMQDPNQGALHAQYKNSLQDEIRLLENKKHDTMRAIIAMGQNPKIAVLNGDSQEVMTLSEYMRREGISSSALPPVPQAPPPPVETTPTDETIIDEPAPTPPPAPRKVGNFIVYDGGKSKTDH